MELDFQTIKAVSVESRIKLLKCMAKSKRMPSGLSKELGLSPSTIIRHLQNLERAGLIRRIETGHKWVYYELTDKGANIIQPKTPMHVILTLLAGVLMASFGLLNLLSPKISVQTMDLSAPPGNWSNPSAEMINKTAESAAESFPGDWAPLLLLIGGLALVAFGLYKLKTKGVIVSVANQAPRFLSAKST